MRLKLAALTAAAATALTFPVHAQQAAPPAPPAPAVHGASTIDTEPLPNATYHGTNEADWANSILDAKPVYAVIAGHVVSGELKPTGRLDALTDARQPGYACQLSQRKTAVRLACTDGAVAEVTLATNGCGVSRAGQPASLCMGWTAKAAVRRLTAPAGQKLSVEGGLLALKPSA